MLVAGWTSTELGYWIFDETLAPVVPFVELYGVEGGQAKAVQIAASPGDSFVVAGTHLDDEVRWLRKIASDGETLWEQAWPSTIVATPASRPVELAVATDSTIVLAIQAGGDGEGGIGIEAVTGAGAPAWGELIEDTLMFGLVGAADGSWIAFGNDLETSDLALHGYTAEGEPSWTRTHDVESLGPMRACPDDRFVLPVSETDTLAAMLFDASGNLLETRTHTTDGELETTAAMCTSNGDVILVGRVTPEL